MKQITSPWKRLSFPGIMLSLVLAVPAFAAPAEDEWYDPTDWFDGNNIEADDTYDGYFDYSYPYDDDGDWDRYGEWSGYDYDSEYWDRYDWNDSSSTTSSSTASSSTGGSSTQAQSGSSSSRSGTAGSGSSTPDTSVVYTYVLFAEPIAGNQQKSGQQKSGQQSSSAAQQSSSGQQASKQSGKNSSQVARLNGTIEGLREMNLRRQSGATGPHTIAKIKLENGKSSVVSLGRSSQLKDLNLQAGDSIQAIGSKGMIDGETVFVAHSLKAKGRMIAANPAIRLKQSQDQQQAQSGQGSQAGAMTGGSAGSQTTLTGEVASASRTSLGQGGNQHTFVDLRLANGNNAILDLGPGASIDKIGLDDGDRITVRGRTHEVQGRPVIKVDLLKIDGEKVPSVSR